MILALLFLILLCGLVIVLEFACLRDPHIPDNHLSVVGRRLRMLGYGYFAIRFAYLIVTDDDLHWVSVIAFAAIGISDVIRCSNRLHMAIDEITTGIEHKLGIGEGK